MNTDAEVLIERYQRQLPGIVRATLIDYGVSESVIARRQIGWDGRSITIPVRDQLGRPTFFERWSDRFGIGHPIEVEPLVELYPWQALEELPNRLVVAEGIHEALAFESQGFPAVAATGSGLFFKTREWAPELRGIPEILAALRSGEKRPRQSFRLSRRGVLAEVEKALPNARIVTWPEAVGPNGGAFEFFVKLKRSPVDFDLLARHP